MGHRPPQPTRHRDATSAATNCPVLHSVDQAATDSLAAVALGHNERSEHRHVVVGVNNFQDVTRRQTNGGPVSIRHEHRDVGVSSEAAQSRLDRGCRGGIPELAQERSELGEIAR